MQDFFPGVAFKIRSRIGKKSRVPPIGLHRWVVEGPGAEVFQRGLRVPAPLYLLHHEPLVRVIPVKKAGGGDVRRVAEQEGHMVVVGDLPQNFHGDVGVHDDLFSSGGQPQELQDLHLDALPGHLLRPIPVLLRRHAQPLLPAAHGVEIAEPGLFPAGELVPREGVVVVFTAVDHAVPLGKHFYHSGLSGIAVAVDEVHIFQVVFDKIIADLYFHKRLSLLP